MPLLLITCTMLMIAGDNDYGQRGTDSLHSKDVRTDIFSPIAKNWKPMTIVGVCRN